METLYEIYQTIPSFVFSALNVLSRVSAVLFIYFSSKYRNSNLKFDWWKVVLCLMFPLIFVLIYLVKRKSYGGNPDMKVCPLCDTSYPQDFESCYKCLAPLPEYDASKKKTQKVLAIAMVVLFCFSYIANDGFSLLGTVYGIHQALGEDLSDEFEAERAVFEDENGHEVYYDAKGKSYKDAQSVVLYSKDGTQYTFDSATACYKGSAGTFFACNCYVDADGYFFYDGNYTLEEAFTDAVRYHYEDKDRNAYYSALNASWDENGNFLPDSSYSLYSSSGDWTSSFSDSSLFDGLFGGLGGLFDA